MHRGDWVAEILVAQGVQFVFTLTGGRISPILTASKAQGIRVIDTRHEANAVFAADAVARLTGVPGVTGAGYPHRAGHASGSALVCGPSGGKAETVKYGRTTPHSYHLKTAGGRRCVPPEFMGSMGDCYLDQSLPEWRVYSGTFERMSNVYRKTDTGC